MPIIFETRLGNSESDKKLRRVYRFHHILWTFYYTLLFAGIGFGAAVIAAVNNNLIFAVLIAVATVIVVVLFLRRQMRRRRRR